MGDDEMLKSRISRFTNSKSPLYVSNFEYLVPCYMPRPALTRYFGNCTKARAG